MTTPLYVEQDLSAATENTVDDRKEVQHTITISNFEKLIRKDYD